MLADNSNSSLSFWPQCDTMWHNPRAPGSDNAPLPVNFASLHHGASIETNRTFSRSWDLPSNTGYPQSQNSLPSSYSNQWQVQPVSQQPQRFSSRNNHRWQQQPQWSASPTGTTFSPSLEMPEAHWGQHNVDQHTPWDVEPDAVEANHEWGVCGRSGSFGTSPGQPTMPLSPTWTFDGPAPGQGQWASLDSPSSGWNTESPDMHWHDPNPRQKRAVCDIGTAIWGDPNVQRNPRPIRFWKEPQDGDYKPQHGEQWDSVIPKELILQNHGEWKPPMNSQYDCFQNQSDMFASQMTGTYNASPAMSMQASPAGGGQLIRRVSDQEQLLAQMCHTKSEYADNSARYADSASIPQRRSEGQSRLSQWKKCPQKPRNMSGQSNSMDLSSSRRGSGDITSDFKNAVKALLKPTEALSISTQEYDGRKHSIESKNGEEINRNQPWEPQSFIPGKRWEWQDPNKLAEHPHATPGNCKSSNPLVISPSNLSINTSSVGPSSSSTEKSWSPMQSFVEPGSQPAHIIMPLTCWVLFQFDHAVTQPQFKQICEWTGPVENFIKLAKNTVAVKFSSGSIEDIIRRIEYVYPRRISQWRVVSDSEFFKLAKHLNLERHVFMEYAVMSQQQL